MKNAKRILSVLLAVAMLMSLPVATSAAGTPAITLTSGTLAAGSTFVCAVTLENNPGIIGADMKLVYDTSSLKIKTITADYRAIDPGVKETGEFVGVTGNPANGEIAWADAYGTTYDGILFWVVFETLSDVFNGDYTVDLVKKDGEQGAFKDLNKQPYEDSSFTITPATITVTGGNDPTDYTPVVTQSTPATVSYGYKAAASAMTVAASVKAGTLSYQWYADGSPVGTDSASYTPATTQCGTVSYTCKVTNTYSGHTFSTTSDVFTVTVSPATLSGSDIALEESTFVYTGSTITPVIDTELVLNTDYTVTGDTSAKNVGDYTVNVTGTNNYTGSVELDWSITPATITVTGGAASMTVYNNGAPFDITPFAAETVDGSDAAIAYAVKSGSEFVTLDAEHLTLTGKGQVGSAVIEVTITAANHTTVVKTINVTVQNKIDVSDKISFVSGSATYDGKEKSHETASMTDGALTGAITYRYEGDRKNAGKFTVTAVYEDATNYGEKTVEFTIEPAVLTFVSAVAVEKEYDGTTDATVNVTFTGAADGDTLTQGVDYTVEALFTGEDGKNVGTDKEIGYVVHMKNNNYINNLSLSGTKGTIKPRTVVANLTVKDGPHIYDGTEQKTAVVSFEGAVAGETLKEDTDYIVTYTDHVNAGSAQIDLDPVVGSNYTFTGLQATFTIDRAPLTIESAKADNKVYDGTTDATVTEVKFSGLCGEDTVDYTASNAKFADENVGENKKVTFNVALDAAVKNYTLTAADGETTAAITPKPVTPVLQAADAVYNGEEKKTGSVTFGADALVEGTDYTVSYENNIEAGTATFIVTPAESGSNYTFTETTKTFAIAKAAAPQPFTGKASLRYNNTADQTLDLNTLKGVKEAAITDVTVTGDIAVETSYSAGVLTYKLPAGLDETADGKAATVTVTFASKNYEPATYVLTVEAMKKVDVSSKLQFADGEYFYTGSDLTHETASVTDSALTGTITYEYTGDRKNVGTFTVTATYEDADNSGTATATVTVKPVSLVVKNADVAEKTYDGTTDATITVTLDGMVNGETLTQGTDYTVEAVFADAKAGENKDVPYTVTLDAAVKNYVLTTASGTAKSTIKTKTVTPALTTVDGTYNGAEQKTASVTFTGMVGVETMVEGTDYTVSYENNLNAGTAKFIVEPKAGSNYTFEKAEKTFEIAQAALTIAEPTAKDKVYDGTTAAEVELKLSGMVGQEVADYSVTATFEDKNVGEWDVDFEVALGETMGNYNLAVKTGTVKASITAREVTPVLEAADVTYTGSAHTHGTVIFQGAAAGETLTEGTDYTVTYENNTNAGTGKFTVKPVGTSNYTFTETTKEFIIAKAKVTGEPAYTEIKLPGKTLADAALAVGTLAPEGTLAWDLPEGTEVEANKEYGWTYVPTNGNYETLTGTIVPYVVHSSPSYTVTPVTAVGGNVSVYPKTASKGRTITVTVTPDAGYALVSLTVTDASGNKLALTDRGNGKYIFTMPRGNVKVDAVFSAGNAFGDVAADAYYYDAVVWAAGKGITNGTSATKFSPDASCTRAQMVTFLWRASGSPEPKAATCAFADVDLGSYYGKAVLWAVENGITNGTSATKFSPDASCTRAQMATFLCRMADGKAAGSTNVFTDVASGLYYTEAVQWAYENGITNGTSATKFSPDASCTRGQMVTFLYRFFVK